MVSYVFILAFDAFNLKFTLPSLFTLLALMLTQLLAYNVVMLFFLIQDNLIRVKT